MTTNFEIKLQSNPLSIDEAIDFVSDPTCGAVVPFIGYVRNHTKGETVRYLEFEAYESMAIKELKKLAVDTLDRHEGVLKIAIYHRIGQLQIGDIPVIITVSSPHRRISFEACQYAIDTLKKNVPIWKKEFLNSGEVWVSATP